MYKKRSEERKEEKGRGADKEQKWKNEKSGREEKRCEVKRNEEKRK